MKDFLKIYLIVYLVVNITFLILSAIVYQVSGYTYPFIRIALGAIIMAGIVGFAVWLFRLEKGNSLLNIILGYIALIPAIFVLRNVFGNYLFRFTWAIYMVIVAVGIIYGVAVYVVTKKHQKEVAALNELLERDDKKKESDQKE